MPQNIFMHFLSSSWTPLLLDLSPGDAEGRLCLSSSQQPLCTKRLLPSPSPVYFFLWPHQSNSFTISSKVMLFFRPLLLSFGHSQICPDPSQVTALCMLRSRQMVFVQAALHNIAFYTPHTTFASHMTQFCSFSWSSPTLDLWSILSKCSTMHFPPGNLPCVFHSILLLHFARAL